MKKIISLILTVALAALLLASCGGGNESNAPVGYYEADGIGYFFADGGVILVDGDVARSCTYTAGNDGTYSIDGGQVTVKDQDLTTAAFNAPEAAVEYYTYTQKAGQKYISGLTDAGKAAVILFVPKGVQGIEAGALEGGAVKAFVIGKNTKAFNVSNGAFSGTNGLNVYIDGQCATTDVTCGNDMLTDTTGVTFYLGEGAYESYKDDYTWGNFSGSMKRY